MRKSGLNRLFKNKNKRLKYISADSVIKESATEKDRYGGVNYLIYSDDTADDFKVRLNTYYKRIGDKIELLNSYDCALCSEFSEYEKLTRDEIEHIAYNCYMTGAR